MGCLFIWVFEREALKQAALSITVCLLRRWPRLSGLLFGFTAPRTVQLSSPEKSIELIGFDPHAAANPENAAIGD
jgi:hypothetical protein